MKEFDLLDGVMVPDLVEPDIHTPADWSAFDTRYNVLLESARSPRNRFCCGARIA